MKIGLYPGTYNPVHNGHLTIAGYMIDHTDIDEVWLIISPQNPFKQSDELAADFHRLEMVRLALGNKAGMIASDIEFGLPLPSYSVNTVSHLKALYPDDIFVLIMGSDNLVQFDQWKDHETILEMCEIYCYPRKDKPAEAFRTHPRIRLTDAPLIDISSTGIRELLKAGKGTGSMLPEKVRAYIRDHKLYLPG